MNNFSLQSLSNALSSLYNSLKSFGASLGTGKSPSPGITPTTGTTLPGGASPAPLPTGSYGAYRNQYTKQSVPIGIASPGYSKWGTDLSKLTASLGAIPAGAQTQPNVPSGYYGFVGYSPQFQSLTPSKEETSTYTPPPTGGGGLSSITTGGAGKSPITTPTPAPVSSNLPPTPTGGSGFVSSVGGAPSSAVPRESSLPPAPNLPSNAIGRYEAMMRALLQQYGNTGKVPVPLGGAPSFGVGSAFGDILKQLQQRARV